MQGNYMIGNQARSRIGRLEMVGKGGRLTIDLSKRSMFLFCSEILVLKFCY